MNINIQQMMKQAQQMQKKIQEQQNSLEKMEFEGDAGNGATKVKINGKGFVLSVKIKEELIDVEEKEMLEDLLVVAFNNAKEKLDKVGGDMMSEATGGLNNMKLPF